MRRVPLVLLLLVTLAACGAEEPAARSPGSTTTPTSRPDGGATADDGLVEVELAVAEEAAAGERLWAQLTVRNIGDRSVYWQAGGGTRPGAVLLVEPEAPDAATTAPVTWNGEPDDLPRSLVPSGPRPFHDEEHVGLEDVARTMESRMEALAPGQEHTRRVAVDLRLGPGAATDLVARAVFSGYDEPEHYGGPGAVGPRPGVVVEVPVRVVGLPASGAAEAVDAFAVDPRLRAFARNTDVPSVDQRWHARLVWWRGAWELTVQPVYSDDERGQSRYRLRYDPDAAQVVDARRIWWDQAPADDPGGTRFPSAPADDVEER